MRFPVLLLAVLAVAAIATAQTTSTKNDTGTSAQTQPTTYDRHIYVPIDGSTNGCFKIKSFNFTRGANPRLKSVTTCTPMKARTEKRAEGLAPQPRPEFRLVQDAEKPR